MERPGQIFLSRPDDFFKCRGPTTPFSFFGPQVGLFFEFSAPCSMIIEVQTMAEIKVGFLDFEASSLSDNSWPIEMGWALVGSDGLVESDGCLIRPAADWSLGDWSLESAAIHGIDLDDVISGGIDAVTAYRKLYGALSGSLVYSDAPKYEARWLERLRQCAGDDRPALRVMPVGLLFQSTLLDEMLFDKKYRKLIRGKVHRAKADAEGWAQLYADCILPIL